MATIDYKDIVDTLIENNGVWPDLEPGEEEPKAVKIVEYTNAWGKTTWGVVFENEADPNRYERASEFVNNPKVIWEAA